MYIVASQLNILMPEGIPTKKVKNEKIVEEYREKTDFFEKPSKIAKRKKARRKMIAQRRFAEQSSPKKEKQNGRV